MDTTKFKSLIKEKCPIYHTINLLGDVWILGIIRASFMGVSKFDQFQAELDISRSVLVRKLSVLTEHEILKKLEYKAPKQRKRFEYSLTERGKDLALLLGAMLQWGNKYLVDQNEGCMEITEVHSKKPLFLAILNQDGGKVELSDVAIRWKNK